MKSGDLLSLTIKDIYLHKEERMLQGAIYGSYTSKYVARFKEYPNGIAVVDELASSIHPDWEKKTENRASILTAELTGRHVSLIVKDVFAGKDTFEGIIQ